MSQITGLTRGGRSWTPHFIVAINQAMCIGCGRCYKVCTRNVFSLVEREVEEEEDGEDDTAMVMSLADPLDCIGCGACSRVCAKGCHSHAPQAA